MIPWIASLHFCCSLFLGIEHAVTIDEEIGYHLAISMSRLLDFLHGVRALGLKPKTATAMRIVKPMCHVKTLDMRSTAFVAG